MAEMVFLQSGFVTKPNSKLAKSIPPSVQDIVSSAVRNSTIPSAVSEFMFHPEISGMLANYLGDQKALLKFAFREQLIVAFKQATGMINFRTWIEAQSQCEYFIPMHRKFLLDTLQFIASGQRRMDIESWQRIMSTSPVAVSEKRERIDTNEWFGEYKPNPKPWDGQVPTLTDDVLVKWLQRPGGFKDLLFFCVIVFGEYKG